MMLLPFFLVADQHVGVFRALQAASQLKKGSKAKGKATDEVEEEDDADHGMFKGKDSEESINKEADRLTTEGAKKLKRVVTKHEKAVQANRSQKAQLEKLEEDLEEAQGGLETYGFDGKVVQVRGSNFSGYGEAGGEVRKTSATVLIPRVFEERKEVMGYYKEDKDGNRKKVKPNPGKTQKVRAKSTFRVEVDAGYTFGYSAPAPDMYGCRTCIAIRVLL